MAYSALTFQENKVEIMKFSNLGRKFLLTCMVSLQLCVLVACQTGSGKYTHTRASAEHVTEWNDPTTDLIHATTPPQSTTPVPSSAISEPIASSGTTNRNMFLIFPELEATAHDLSDIKNSFVIGLAAYLPGIERISANGLELEYHDSDFHYQDYLVEPGARTVQFQVPLEVADASNLIEITATGTDGKKTLRQLRLEEGKPKIVKDGSSEEGRKIIKQGRYWALLIANQNYTNIDSLLTPYNDVQALKTVLINQYGFDAKRIFLKTDATLNTMREALDHIHDKVEGNDSLLLYYAGHGHLDEEYGDKGFWIPVDGKIPSSKNKGYRTTWLPNSQVHDMIQASRAKHVLLISDSCYSGTFKTRTISKPQSYAASMDFFYKKAANYSRRAITSGNLEPVADGGGGKHSVFAYHLLQILENTNRTLNAEHLFQELRDKVTQAAQQRPQYFIIDSQKDKGGDFVFVSR